MKQEFVTLPRAVVEQAIAALTDLAGWRAAPLCDLLRAALEQPPTAEQSSVVEQQQGEQEPVAGVVIRDGLPCLLQDRHIKSTDHRVYTHPQPKREPLTDMQKMMCWSRATHDADVLHKTEHQCLMDYASEIEAAHNIK